MRIFFLAVLFTLALSSGQTLIHPKQLRGSVTALLGQCAGATSPASDCTALYYVEILRPDGSTLRLLAVAAPQAFSPDPPAWSLVP